MDVAPLNKLLPGERLWRIELYHASVVRGCRELFSRTLLVANKWGGNSTGGVRGRRRREGPGNLFGEGTRESESF